MTLLTRLVEIMEEIEHQRLCFPGIICLQYDNSRPDRVGVLHVDVDLSGMRRGCGESGDGRDELSGVVPVSGRKRDDDNPQPFHISYSLFCLRWDLLLLTGGE